MNLTRRITIRFLSRLGWGAVLLCAQASLADDGTIVGVHETFQHRTFGPFDNDGWFISGEVGFDTDGLTISNAESSSSLSYQRLSGFGSFHATLDFKDFTMGTANCVGPQDDIFATAGASIQTDDASGILLIVSSGCGSETWSISISGTGGQKEIGVIPASPGDPISFVIDFDAGTSNVDLNVVNATGIVHNLQSEFRSRDEGAELLEVSVGGFSMAPQIQQMATITELSVEPARLIPGDFNANGELDLVDLRFLEFELDKAVRRSRFDVDGNLSVDADDLVFWVRHLKHGYLGDGNLDGEFARSDLINAFAAGEYEDSIDFNSNWETGDWNGDRDFTTSDLVLAFQDGGYEQGPRAASGVPEPIGTGLFMLAFVLVWLTVRSRRFVTARPSERLLAS